MKRYRIGNDIDLEWTILKEDGTAYDLTGKNISLCMTCGGSHYEVTDFSVAANVISWTFFGKDQARCGAYDVILRENCGEVDMITVDRASALMLVARTASEGGQDDSRIHTSCRLRINTFLTPEEIAALKQQIQERTALIEAILEAEEELGADFYFNAGGKRVINLAAPVDNTDAANKKYVDDADAALKTYVDEADASLAADILALQEGKVDKVEGKGLSTNDFTDALKAKLEGINLAPYALIASLGSYDLISTSEFNAIFS